MAKEAEPVKRNVLAAGLLATLTACGGPSVNLRLYPIDGPIKQSNPSQIIAVKVSNQTTASADISFVLPGPGKKNRCNGTWTSVAPRVIEKERGLSLTLQSTGGKLNKSVTDVGGVNSGEIYAVCTDGARVQGRFITGSGTESGTGTVTDTLGNTYKLLF
ncbi:MAG: hypothetical protein WCO04_00105 [Pseudomonadota bacterium]